MEDEDLETFPMTINGALYRIRVVVDVPERGYGEDVQPKYELEAYDWQGKKCGYGYSKKYGRALNDLVRRVTSRFA